MSDIQKVFLERDEAIKFVKKSYRPGISHFVRGGTTLYTQVPDGDDPGRGYQDMMVNIPVSQKDALYYIKQVITDVFAEKKVKIEISVSEPFSNGRGGCIFIG